MSKPEGRARKQPKLRGTMLSVNVFIKKLGEDL